MVDFLCAIFMSEQSRRYAFYKGYFEQKQRDLGKDPEEVLRDAGVI